MTEKSPASNASIPIPNGDTIPSTHTNNYTTLINALVSAQTHSHSPVEIKVKYKSESKNPNSNELTLQFQTMRESAKF